MFAVFFRPNFHYERPAIAWPFSFHCPTRESSGFLKSHDFKQAGERYRAFDNRERDDLIENLVCNLKDCPRDIQERMIAHFTQADAEYGRRVADGIKKSMDGSSSGKNGANDMSAKAKATAAK